MINLLKNALKQQNTEQDMFMIVFSIQIILTTHKMLKNLFLRVSLSSISINSARNNAHPCYALL
jgi:hypothetical protein